MPSCILLPKFNGHSPAGCRHSTCRAIRKTIDMQEVWGKAAGVPARLVASRPRIASLHTKSRLFACRARRVPRLRRRAGFWLKCRMGSDLKQGRGFAEILALVLNLAMASKFE